MAIKQQLLIFYDWWMLPSVSKITSSYTHITKGNLYTMKKLTVHDIHNVAKCLSYHGAIGGLVITERAHCLSFCLYIYITLILLL